MELVLLIFHALLAIILIIVVLLQRAEGGALGIGGGSDGMSPRGSADILTRTTAIIAVLFVITSISLTILSMKSSDRSLSFDEIEDISIEKELPDNLPELPQLD
jgi:preprotein translocase subunit SecG|tara:strand:+ start:287 stop:598 length:312 start_codon:yes stop_codon:yes gene_type:complete